MPFYMSIFFCVGLCCTIFIKIKYQYIHHILKCKLCRFCRSCHVCLHPLPILHNILKCQFCYFYRFCRFCYYPLPTLHHILKCKLSCFCHFCHVGLYPHHPLPDILKCWISHFCHICQYPIPTLHHISICQFCQFCHFCHYPLSLLCTIYLNVTFVTLLHLSLAPPYFTPYIEISVLLLLSCLSIHTFKHTPSYISLYYCQECHVCHVSLTPTPTYTYAYSHIPQHKTS